MAISFLLLFFLITGGLSPNGFVWSSFSLKFEDVSRFNYLNEALAEIPKDAAVSAQTSLVPHLANRERVYLFPDVWDAKYIVLDTSLSTYPLEPDVLKKKVYELKDSPAWELVVENKTLIIFKRRAE